MRALTWLPVLVAVLCNPVALAASLQKAEMLYEHGLVDDSKRELIGLIFEQGTSDADRASAHYLLGTIAFENDQVALALRTWRILIDEHPQSEPAKLVKGRIDELASIVGESLRESIDNAVALSYLRQGDFWSRGKSRAFTIDTSWIPNVDVAMKWYDKVIQEFPGTTAARVASEEKMRTLIGWENPGRYGTKHGIQGDFARYMPILESTFQAYADAFPEAPSLQAFRYQIAQGYWNNKQWDETRQWLRQIVEKAGEVDSFYKDLATRRLQKVEY
ncbi:MAG: tetratricopeptide repeat protein [Phycisphaerales bacterium]|nr:tetratricopeptide repeat protein [Phycisphaerales bacterium]